MRRWLVAGVLGATQTTNHAAAEIVVIWRSSKELASSWMLTAPSVALQVFLKSSPLPCDSPWHLDGHRLQTSAQAFHISPWNNFSEVARLPLANCFHSNKFHFFFSFFFYMPDLFGHTTVPTTPEPTARKSALFIFLPVKLLVNQLVCFPEAQSPPLSCGIPEQMRNILLKWWWHILVPCHSIPVARKSGHSLFAAVFINLLKS